MHNDNDATSNPFADGRGSTEDRKEDVIWRAKTFETTFSAVGLRDRTYSYLEIDKDLVKECLLSLFSEAISVNA